MLGRILGLRDLADEMFAQMKQSNQLELQAEAFSRLPQPVLTPNHTYQRLLHDEVYLSYLRSL